MESDRINQSRLLAGLFNQFDEPLDYDILKGDINKISLYKTPISTIMEYCQCLNVSPNFIESYNNLYNEFGNSCFTFHLQIQSTTYTKVRGSSKKDAKQGAAYVAWKKIIENLLNEVKNKEIRNFGDFIACEIHKKFLEMSLIQPNICFGKKILAGFYLKMNDNRGIVVSIGTGNKCISSNKLTLDGKCLLDTHAEVIARRGLKRYLMEEIERLMKNEASIFEKNSNTLKLKDNYSFHLYISCAPCGDAAIFRNEKLSSDSKVQSLLRTKIEAGEGAVPVEDDYQQSLLSLRLGKRLRLMSCSDKVCRWINIGLQGGLLSYFIKPIYLKSVTIGDKFFREHLNRALNDRNYTNSGNVEIFHTSEEVPFHSQRLSQFSINWYQWSNIVELVEGAEGLQIDSNCSRLSKYALIKRFQKLCTNLNQGKILKDTYRETKENCLAYGLAKKVLYDKFKENKCGTWVNAPIELSLFKLTNQP